MPGFAYGLHPLPSEFTAAGCPHGRAEVMPCPAPGPVRASSAYWSQAVRRVTGSEPGKMTGMTVVYLVQHGDKEPGPGDPGYIPARPDHAVRPDALLARPEGRSTARRQWRVARHTAATAERRPAPSGTPRDTPGTSFQRVLASSTPAGRQPRSGRVIGRQPVRAAPKSYESCSDYSAGPAV